MNAVLLEQTTVQLTRQTSRWDRRLRLSASLIWVPRGLMVGLVAGIVVALISRLRPWLLPEQIVVIASVALAISGIAALGLIWLWPRSKTQRARYFDQRFGLKERISTALELAAGLLPYSDQLGERQLNDAVGSAQGVNLAARLPLRVYWREIVAVIALVLLLGYLLIVDNPMNQQIRSQRDWQNALDSQIANLDENIQRIEQNPALSAEQKDALTQPLQQARDILQQKGVTQEEAVAASQSLKDQTNGMSTEQQTAYQNAASQLGRTGLTGDMADALQKPDLNAAANAMDDMSQQLGNSELSQQQQQQVADQLDSAAQQMQQADPQTAQHLSQAAKALRSGDQQAAQQAMQQAADSAREQQAQNQNSAAAQAAQNAAQQAQQSQQDLAQAGQQTTASQSGEPQPGPEGAQPQENTGQQGPQSQQQQSQSNQSQQSQAGQSQSGSDQQDQTSTGQDQAGQPGQGQPQQADGNQTQQQGGGNGPSDQGEGQPGNQPASSGNQQGEGQGADANPSAGDSTSGSQREQGGSLSAGSGEGGAGMDTTTGTVVETNGQQTQANNGAQESSMQDYNPAYDSTTIGGPVDQTVDVGGQGTSQAGEVVQEGDFGPNPAGESTLSYTGVYSSYQGVVSDALESGRIPLDQRDVIHDYFSSLDR
jgi:hypothetical protein